MIKGADRLALLTEYFFSLKLKEIKSLEMEGRDIINLGIGSPDMAPPSEVSDALANSAKIPTNHGYQPYHGTAVLRDSISNWMRNQFDLNVNPKSQILPLLGSKEGILHISMAFLNPGDTVAIPELGYPAYRSVSNMVGANLVEYPLDENWLPDWDQMDNCKDAKILWLNYPHMPTGTCATLDVLSKAVEFGLNNDVLICHDNPYSHVLNQDPLSIHNVKGSLDVCLELHSLSKSHSMAGWRVGWIVGNEEYLSNLLKIKSNIDSGMFRAIQDASVTALNLKDDWHKTRNNAYARRQAIAFDILSQTGCSFKSSQSGLFVWGELPNKSDSENWSDELLHQKSIFITPGFIFGERGRSFIRISLCATEGRLQEALKRIT